MKLKHDFRCKKARGLEEELKNYQNYEREWSENRQIAYLQKATKNENFTITIFPTGKQTY